MKYLRASRIRQYAKDAEKRVSPAYLAWLDHKIEAMIRSHIRMLGSKKTLRPGDPEAVEKFNKALAKRRRL